MKSKSNHISLSFESTQSPHQVNTEGITSGPFELQKENIPSTGDNLLTWARDRYSAVVSFTEAVLANKFDITVGKASKCSNSLFV